ncbi:MAG: fused MFS/spermidine synthase [Gemmataceae bacterium]|nr:fused MFS/spermidine synthase [Gemmataceae bacterium]
MICLVVFLANAALLVLQLVAGRMMSPYIGSSLATWTSVIGMFLAGISAGNWYGGRVADRAASGRTLRLILWSGAAALLSSIAVIRLLGDGSIVRGIPLHPRIALVSFLVCFPTAFTLSLTTPVAIKLLLPDVHKTGRVVGMVYALGTLGSLAGNFFTGFHLMAYFGVTALVCGAAGVMAILGAIVPGRLVAGEVPEPVSNHPEQDLTESLTVPAACGIVFLASFCSMAIELTASRLLAPVLGVSIYTWTGIIGVVLAGVTVGNWLGGWIADRSPRRSTLGGSLFWTGFLTAMILAVFAALSAFNHNPDDVAPGFWPPHEWAKHYLKVVVYRISEAGIAKRVVASSLMLFFLPMVAFGTISPQVTRLAVAHWSDAGRVAGRIYAWSCAGAIVGTFATGWALIGLLGSMTVILAVAAVMVSLSMPVGNLWRKPMEFIASGVILLLLMIVIGAGQRKFLSHRPDAIYCKETNYYLISISSEDDEDTARRMVLDLLIHSHIYGNWINEKDATGWYADVSRMGYGHEQVQAEFLRAAAAETANPHVLVIGGGGYTLPRWIDKFVPQAQVDVVEIDPGVTEAVYAALGMPRDTKIKTYNLDGRQYIQELAPPRGYQLIVQDAVNDLSVPAHIMTKQYNDGVRKALSDDGVYLLTVIDEYEDGRLLPAAIKTMQATFPHVTLLGEVELWDKPTRSVFVIAGTNQPINPDRLDAALKKQGVEMVTKVMPQDRLREYMEKSEKNSPIPLLTDDFAPVDHLIAETFRRR